MALFRCPFARRTVLALLLSVSALAPAQGVVAWGENDWGKSTVPEEAKSGVTAIAAGANHGLAVKNGGVIAWGYNNARQATVPEEAKSGVTAVAAGPYHSLALKDGGVIAWGFGDSGQTAVPAEAESGVAAIAAGGEHGLALKDGGVIAWGADYYGQASVPLAAQSGVTAIAAGYAHNLALKNGGVVAWGWNSGGQCDVPAAALSDVVAVAAGSGHSLALKSDGTVVAWGRVGSGVAKVPSGLTGVVAIAAGSYHNVALRSDGSVVTWKVLSDVLEDAPQAARGAKTVAAGLDYTLALEEPVPVVSASFNRNSYVKDSTQRLELTLSLDAPRSRDLQLALEGATGLGVPATATIPAGRTSLLLRLSPTASLTAGTAVVAVKREGSQVATATLRVSPLAPTLVLDSQAVAPGETTLLRVRLNGSPARAVQIALSCDDPWIYVPPTMTVSPGQTEIGYPVGPSASAESHKVLFAAELDGMRSERPMRVVGNELASLALGTSEVKGGETLSCTVSLQSPALADTEVYVWSDKPGYASVPVSVTVPAGASSVEFDIPTATVKARKQVKITVGKGTKSLKSIFFVTP